MPDIALVLAEIHHSLSHHMVGHHSHNRNRNQTHTVVELYNGHNHNPNHSNNMAMGLRHSIRLRSLAHAQWMGKVPSRMEQIHSRRSNHSKISIAAVPIMVAADFRAEGN